MSRWNPRAASAVSNARRRASLSSLQVGMAGLARRQRALNGRSSAPAPMDASWTLARVLAANLVIFCALGAVVLLISSVLEHISRQAYFVIFVLLTLFLIRRGSRLRRRGLERLGRSVTAWAGVTGSLVVVSAASSLAFTQFVPELIGLGAGWLLVLGVWKDLPTLVTTAVVLVGPMVWGAFVWNRSLVGAVLIVVAAGAYARSGRINRALFGALVVVGVVVSAATVHQLTHTRTQTGFDGADLLALLIVIVCLVAAGEVESWQADWLAYATVMRSITAASAVVLAAVAARPGEVEAWAAETPTAALSRVVIAGIIVMITLWVVVMNRSVQPGGHLKVATWTLVVMLLLGALLQAYSLSVIRWVAVVALALWGLRSIRSGLRRSKAWMVVGGFTVVFGASLPVVAPRQGLVPLVLLLLAVAAAGAVVVMLSTPLGPSILDAAAGGEKPLAPTPGVR